MGCVALMWYWEVENTTQLLLYLPAKSERWHPALFMKRKMDRLLTFSLRFADTSTLQYAKYFKLSMTLVHCSHKLEDSV